MNRLPAAWNRITAAIVGIALIAIGLAGILTKLEVRQVTEWTSKVDSNEVDKAADADWWTWVLVAVVAIGVIWGFLLLRTLIRPQSVTPLTLDGSDEQGKMTVAPGLVASAVAADLQADSRFSSVSVKAIDDRGTKILRVGVSAPASMSFAEITDAVGTSVNQVREALPATDLHVQVMVDLEPVAQ